MWGFWCSRWNLDGNSPAATMWNANMYIFVGNPSISWEPQKGELHLSNTKRIFSTMDKSWQSAHPRHKKSQVFTLITYYLILSTQKSCHIISALGFMAIVFTFRPIYTPSYQMSSLTWYFSLLIFTGYPPQNDGRERDPKDLPGARKQWM